MICNDIISLTFSQCARPRSTARICSN